MKKFKLAGLLAGLGLFSIASGTVSAAIIDFSFSNVGSIDDAQSCGFNCALVSTTGTAVETGGLAGSNSWAFEGLMEFSATGFLTLEGNGTDAGLGWNFADLAGINNLFGTFSTELGPIWFGLGGPVDYSIGGGTGLFAGATGYGASNIVFGAFSNRFTEKGWMHAVTLTSVNVPEPGMTGLLAAGLGMIGFVAFRRRRALPRP